jgi:2-polyprenyl-3-methyl-5-hydroxy-6-metoxy-1,4-benzoquinol methylase
MSKYDYYNPNPYSVHQKIVHSIGKNKKVLDVGCSEGLLSKRIYQNNCTVVGIELDTEAALKAKSFCNEVIIGDVESVDLNLEYLNYFDVIVFADILEHLKDPLEVLKTFKNYLTDEGYIIISVPNIANWKIRLQLLFGNFEYSEYGILDNSHLRFFNEKSVRKLVNDAGFEISVFDLSVGDVNKFSKIFHSIGIIRPNLLAFQFLIIAKTRKKQEILL